MHPHHSLHLRPSFLVTRPPGVRPDRAVKVINNLGIYIRIKVLEFFCARLRIPIRHVLQAYEDRLSIASPILEILSLTLKPFS